MLKMFRHFYFKVIRGIALIYLESREAAALTDAKDPQRSTEDRFAAITLALKCTDIILDIKAQKHQEALMEADRVVLFKKSIKDQAKDARHGVGR